MNLKRRIPALLLAAVLCLGLLSACDQKPPEPSPSQSAAPSASPSMPEEKPLVVSYGGFSGNFSPFYMKTVSDRDVTRMTQLSLLTTDRNGEVVYKAIGGETRSFEGKDYTYSGPADITVIKNGDGAVYRIKLRDDIRFSDGQKADVDDLIFTYYVLCDPSYAGAGSLRGVSIEGLKEYQTQTSTALYDKYADLFHEAYQGRGEYVASAAEYVKAAWIEDVAAIVSYCINNYIDSAETYTGYTPSQIVGGGMQVMFAMVTWGYGQIDAQGALVSSSGKTWDLKTAFPTVEDFYKEFYDAYDGDCERYWKTEGADDTDVYSQAKNAFIAYWSALDPEYAGGIESISGIRRVNDLSLEIVTTEYAASDVYALCGVSIAPMHYYGLESLYDYEKNSFGFLRGFLSHTESRTGQPMGAGPYRFMEAKDGTIRFEANDYYYKGKPETLKVQFVTAGEEDPLEQLTKREINVANLPGTKEALETVRNKNTEKSLTGDQLHASVTDYPGFGYIGINAETVKVGSRADSEASKNLRRALATVLAVFREDALEEYFGEAGSVIEYPAPDISWAAPTPADTGYQIAYSKDQKGEKLYEEGMAADEKEKAALKAAEGFLKAAGFSWDSEGKKFTAAPDGAKLIYELIIPGGGKKDHPSAAIAKKAAKAFESLGITLSVNDPEDENELWTKVFSGTQELWAAAWDTAFDPDLYQLYDSGNIPGLGGSDSNYTHIADPKLDKLISQARTTDDKAKRRELYKSCYDIILDWAVVVPCYQRKDLTVFSAQTVETGSIAPDLSPWWGWMREIDKLKLSEGS